MYRYELVRDDEPINPREDDNIGKMICFHKRYHLGDKHSFRHDDYNSWDEMEAGILRELGPGVVLPLYLYDHSGQSISTTPFGCPWDSGQVGFIYASKADILREYGGKILTKKKKEQAISLLIGEVNTYDTYLRRDVWGYRIIDGDGNEVESLWGILGQEYAESEAKGTVKRLARQDAMAKEIRSNIKRMHGDRLAVKIDWKLPSVCVSEQGVSLFYAQGEGAATLLEGVPDWLSDEEYILYYLDSAGVEF